MKDQPDQSLTTADERRARAEEFVREVLRIMGNTPSEDTIQRVTSKIFKQMERTLGNR